MVGIEVRRFDRRSEPSERLVHAARSLAEATESTVEEARRAAWSVLFETQYAVLVMSARWHCRKLYHRNSFCAGSSEVPCDGAFESALMYLTRRAIGLPANERANIADQVRQSNNSWLAAWWRSSCDAVDGRSGDAGFGQHLARLARRDEVGVDVLREWNGARGLLQRARFTKSMAELAPSAYRRLLAEREWTTVAVAVSLAEPFSTGRGAEVEPSEEWLVALHLDACQTSNVDIDFDRVARYLASRVRTQRDWTPPEDLDTLLESFAEQAAGPIERLFAAIDPDWVSENLGRARSMTRTTETHHDERFDDNPSDGGDLDE